MRPTGRSQPGTGSEYAPHVVRRHSIVAVLALATLLVGCGSERWEVLTNSGGVLDCPSDTILYVMMDGAIHSAGAATAAEGLDRIGEDSGRPTGNPAVEVSAGDFVIFAFLDDSGNRVGRVMVRLHLGGWFVQWTERCG